jgi:hypothetical protein
MRDALLEPSNRIVAPGGNLGSAMASGNIIMIAVSKLVFACAFPTSALWVILEAQVTRASGSTVLWPACSECFLRTNGCASSPSRLLGTTDVPMRVIAPSDS